MLRNDVLPVLFLLLSGACLSLQAQTRIYGQVSDADGVPLTGANVYVRGSFDGASTDTSGRYTFTTSRDTIELVASYLGYQTYERIWVLGGGELRLDLTLEAQATALGAVLITAGAFEAGDEKKGVVLNAIDIATTAGATADIATALNMLPGTQLVGDQGQLFVRGGDAHETRVFMDGLRVATPYTSRVPDIPARGRFSPFMFKGTLFSTGGYAAEYGQALSSALLLETQDLPEKSETGLSLMTLGAELSHTQRWKQTSFTGSAQLTHLGPYFQWVPQNRGFEKAPRSYGAALSLRHRTQNQGMFKWLGSTDRSVSDIRFPALGNTELPETYALENDNLFIQSTYRQVLKDTWALNSGISYARNQESIALNQGKVDLEESTAQARAVLSREWGAGFRLLSGASIFYQTYSQGFRPAAGPDTLLSREAREVLAAGFAEAQWTLGKAWAFRSGLRGEFSSLQQRANLAPRISLAYKAMEHGQFSLAMGQYFQSPNLSWLAVQPRLPFERATHLILNYQWEKDRRLFRIEGYHKQYQRLTRYAAGGEQDPSAFRADGKGYARGLDLFWRDRNTFKYADYWVSYSWLDTRRLYRDFPQSAVPAFASAHNFSWVGKYFFTRLNTQWGLTYRYASGRPYEDPHLPAFNESRTPDYHDLSTNLSYLTSLWGNFTILYVAVNNLLGRENIFGYHYAPTPDARGQYARRAILPPARRFFFVGLFLSFD